VIVLAHGATEVNNEREKAKFQMLIHGRHNSFEMLFA
jgi:hypothetical protein